MQKRSIYPGRLWRLSMAVRNLLLGLWLAGLATQLLAGFFVSWSSYAWVFETACGCWFISCFLAVVVMLTQLRYMKATLQTGRVNAIGCWINGLADLKLGRFAPQPGDQRYAKTAEFADKIRTPLIAGLQALRPADRKLLSAAQMQLLYRFLDQDDTPLTLAILQALAHIGDQTTLGRLQSIADGQVAKQHNAHVREVARTCAEQIRQRYSQGRSPHVLLRGSVAPVAPPGELLHPVQHSSEAAQETLLRATEGTEN